MNQEEVQIDSSNNSRWIPRAGTVKLSACRTGDSCTLTAGLGRKCNRNNEMRVNMQAKDKLTYLMCLWQNARGRWRNRQPVEVCMRELLLSQRKTRLSSLLWGRTDSFPLSKDHTHRYKIDFLLIWTFQTFDSVLLITCGLTSCFLEAQTGESTSCTSCQWLTLHLYARCLCLTVRLRYFCWSHRLSVLFSSFYLGFCLWKCSFFFFFLNLITNIVISRIVFFFSMCLINLTKTKFNLIYFKRRISIMIMQLCHFST